jgi:hypothetical protein
MTTVDLRIPALRTPNTTTPLRRVRVAGDLFHGRVPSGAVYVGRPAPGLPGSGYANPHKLGLCRVCGARHDQAGVVAAYVRHLESRPDLVVDARRELAGMDLACWCRLDVPCHGDVLLARITGPRVWLANSISPEPLDRPTVRDGALREWTPSSHGRYSTSDGRHQSTWAELHASYDLIEVIS